MSIETNRQAMSAARRFNIRKHLVASAAILGGLAVASTGHAQTASAAPPAASAADQSTVVQEIYVTARKREERLIDVPVAITAMNAEAVNRYGIKDIKALTQNVPNLFITPVASGSGSSIAIRGLGSLGADVGVPNEVSFDLDGVPVNRGRVVFLGFLDLQSVEVLKGPQALYFGKNSPAGVVSVTSADPGHTFGGSVRASYEFRSVSPSFEGTLDAPIGDTLAVRLAFKTENTRGYLRNTAEPLVDPFGYAPIVDPGALHKYQDGLAQQIGRITIDFHPNERFTAVVKLLSAHYLQNSETATNETTCGLGTTSIVTQNGFGFGPVVVDPNGDCQKNLSTSSGGLARELAAHMTLSNGGVPFSGGTNNLATANLNYKFDWLTLTSVTGYFDTSSGFFDNFGYSSVSFYMGGATEKFHQFSEELRAVTTFTGPLNGTMGFYYEDSTDHYRVSDYFVPLGPDPRNGNINSIDGIDVTTDKTYSVFGQLDWKLPANLNLTAGARWTHEKKLATLMNTFVNATVAPFGIFQPEGDMIIAPTTGDNVSPEVTLSWHPQPDINIYGKFATGYKSGGTSNPGALQVNTAATLNFRPEKSIGGEIGAKGEWMDGALRGDIVVYSYTFKNLQVQSLDQTHSPAAFRTTNAAEARTQGFEAQGSYRVIPELTLRGNLGYNRAKYVSFPDAACSTDQLFHLTGGCVGGVQDLSGYQLPRAPKWSAGGGFTYTHDVGPGWLVTLVGDASYMGDYNPSDSLIPAMAEKGYVRLEAGIKLSDPEKGWEISLSGRNLTDHRALTDGYDKSGGLGGVYEGAVIPPRQITIAVGYKF